MTAYTAPLRDMRFVMHELLGVGEMLKWPRFAGVDAELIDAVIDQAAAFGGEVIAPLNQSGDREGARWVDGAVTTPAGYAAAYRGFVEAGWQGLVVDPAHGGQGLPKLAGAAVQEIWKAGSHAWSICQALTQGGIEALLNNGSAEQIARWLPRLIGGTWTATMNLTEPQAGSDLSRIRTSALRQGDGSYRIKGQKCFISFGEHDMSDNIVHFVLARTPEAPAGSAGISLFIVPKYLMNADGTRGARNDVKCIGIESKLGLHGSPTCAMSYGENGGAVGELIGQEHQGLRCMFTMMNSGRISAGLEGVGVAERAWQQALAYARSRIQGRDAVTGADATIIRHADVRRMLMLMRSRIEAMRALAYWSAAAQDIAAHHPDDGERARYAAFVDLMTPIVKGWCAETGLDVAQLGIQIHGGAGYMEETGAAQHARDLRVSTIYEGTTGIQAQDLVGRKIIRDGGRAVSALMAEMRAALEDLGHLQSSLPENYAADASAIHAALRQGMHELATAVDRLIGASREPDSRAAAVGAVAFLHLMGTVCGGWLGARAACVAFRTMRERDNDTFLLAKIVCARFYAEHVMPQAAMHGCIVAGDGRSALRIADNDL